MSEAHHLPDVHRIRERLARRHAEAARAGVDGDPVEAARALAAKGAAFEEEDDCEEALAAFREVILKFGKAVELEIREQVAFSPPRTGMILCFLHRREEASGALGALLKRFPGGESEKIDEHLEVARERYQLLLHPDPWR